MTAVLEVSDLTISFGQVTAAQGLNVSVDEGELVGVIGPNGAGKTTFLNLVTGYVRPNKGQVRLRGNDIVGKHPNQVTAMGVGRSFQSAQLFLDLTVLENVLVALGTADGVSLSVWSPLRRGERVKRAGAVLERFGMGQLADRPAAEIAEGSRKLLDVALAFALKPTLLLMDEPTSGVSVDDKLGVMDTLVGVLRDERVTALFVEHDMDVVRRYAERVLVLSEGQIIADGTPTDVLEDKRLRRFVGGWS